MSTLSPEPSPLSSPQHSTAAVLDREEVTLPVEPGDHERFSHYVEKDKILESAMTGAPVVALCGKIWVPGRDPQKFPVCPLCKEVYEGLRKPGDQGKGKDGAGSGAGSAGGDGS